MSRYPSPTGSRVVVKVGSSSLALASGGVDADALERVAAEVAEAWTAGYPTVLVTSAAVAAGLPVLGITERPRDVASSQVAAAVGQVQLMERYTTAFARHGRVVGQVLLTRDILANREQYVHSRTAMQAMLDRGIVPVVNENDTVVVDELKLGDNDRLAAIVSHLVAAERLIMLTDTAGLYSGDPRHEADATLLSAVQHTDEALDALSAGASGPLGSGGVATKVLAARMAAWSGIPTVIADSKEPAVVLRSIRGAEVGTWVGPRPNGLSARRLWIAFGLPASGRIHVDAGAREALVTRNRSLLAVGIRSVEGSFGEGDAVELIDDSGALIGKGIARRSAESVRRIQGMRSGDHEDAGVVVHRDDLVVLAETG